MQSSSSSSLLLTTTFCIAAIISCKAFSPCPSAIYQEQGYKSSRRYHHNLLSHRVSSPIVRKAAESDEDEDDGWGSTSLSSSSSPDRTSKSQELANLQNDLALKQQKKNSQASSIQPESEERDLFIPIFALVSVIGFTGLYGYEMLRLYSRGELYLPWNN